MTTIHNGTTLGVYLSSSTYTNPVAVEAGVVISNVSGGPGVFGSAASGFWTIQNAGSIDAYYGVFLFGGGSVTNTTAASIIGVGHGIAMSNGAGTVVNDGNISSTQTISYGVRLTDGGAVTNTAGASIIGGIVGVHISNGPGTVVNDGTISGFYTVFSYGVRLAKGGLVINGAAGLITGANYGIALSNAYNAHPSEGGFGTVINEGTIIGNGSIAPIGNGNGIVFYAGGSVTNTTSASIMGTRDGIRFKSGTGTVVNAASASIVGGERGVYFFEGGTLINAGIIGTELLPGNDAAVVFGGTYNSLLVVDPGAIFNGMVVGGGVHSTIELASGVSTGTITEIGTQFNSFGSIEIDAGAAWYISGNTTGLDGTISGFTSDDTIEVTGITATGSIYIDGVLTLTENSGSVELHLPGDFATANFVVTNNAAGAEITTTEIVPCFGAGTRIATGRGALAVEHLKLDDMVLTVSGESQAVQWIGHRHVNCRRHIDQERVWPICIAPHAFGQGRPERALFLSPDHSVFVEDVLIPIKFLLNGTTVKQVQVDEIKYYHIELPRHDVVLSEGLPTESYLETGGRAAFANSGTAMQLYPNFAADESRVAVVWKNFACAPLLGDGDQLNRARMKLQWQASMLDAGRVEPDETKLRQYNRARSARARL